MKGVTVTAIAAPSVGPALVTLFGIDVPVMALCLSVAGLILARVVAPPPLAFTVRDGFSALHLRPSRYIFRPLRLTVALAV